MDAVNELFVFLEPNADPAVDRVRREHPGGVTLLIWAADGTAAAKAAAEQAEHGVRLIELYRGFDLDSATLVIEAVAGRAPVGVAGYGLGSVPSPAALRSTVAIYGDPGANPAVDTVVRDSVHGRTTVIPVPDDDTLVRVAAEQAERGVDVIEICGGTPLTTARRAQEAVGGQAPVSLVTWPFESIDLAAAYKAEFESETAA